MKLMFRTVTGKHYEIDIDPGETIATAKQMLEKMILVPTKNMSLILAAQLLSDEEQISNINLKEDNYIIIHASTKTRVIPKPEEEPITDFQTPIQPDRAFAMPSASSPTPLISLPDDPPNFEELANTLAEMGFSIDLCRAALRQNRYNTEHAANALLIGDVRVDEPPQPPIIQEIPQRDTGGRYGMLQDRFDGLMPEEQTAVGRLEQLGLEPAMVLQVYLACEKNEETSADCIRSMLG